MIRWLGLIFILPGTALGKSVDCSVEVNKTNDRQIDMVLPSGNQISVVGHRHAKRQSGAFDTESAFPAILALSKQDLAKNLTKDPSWPQKIKEAIKSEAAAIKLYSDDYKNLETNLEQNRYVGVGIEVPIERLIWNAENSTKIIENSKFAFDMLKVETNLRQRYKLLALSPQFLLKQQRPSLFKGRQIFTAEPTQPEINDYNKQFCSKIPKANTPSEFASFAAFTSSIRARLPDREGEVISFFANGDPVEDKLLSVNPMLRAARFKPAELAAELLKSFPIEITETERKHLMTYFEIRLQNASRFEGCSARDALIAKNLVRQSDKGSVINFIGANHLPAIKYYLEEECKKIVSGKEPVKKDLPVSAGTR